MMLKALPALVVIAVLAVAACAAPEPVRIATLGAFDPAEVAFIHETGPNTVQGQAFLRQRGGGVVTCAGAGVSLVPRGSYSVERMRNIYGTTERAARAVAWADDPAPVYGTYLRRTVCDAQGNFAFEGLADGDYFVTTVVAWSVPQTFGSAVVMRQEGGAVMAPAAVSGGKTVRLVIAP